MSFFFDLNQGMLPYLPGVLILFIFLLVRSWRRKERFVYELLLVIVLMTIFVLTTTNWNSDAEGIMRYAVWFLPLLIWGVVEGSNFAFRTDRILLVLVLVSQIVVFISVSSLFSAKPAGLLGSAEYVNHNALARYFLDNHPYLYNPEPEIFTERTLKQEVSYTDNLPIVYYRADGSVSKALTDVGGLEILANNGAVDPVFLEKERGLHQWESGVLLYQPATIDEQLKTQTALSVLMTGIQVDKRLMGKWHPDKCGDDIERCEEYRFSFSKDEVMEHATGYEFWLEHFGRDSSWGTPDISGSEKGDLLVFSLGIYI